MVKTNQATDFYRELDQKSAGRSCCSCSTIVVGLVVLVIAGSVSVWYLWRLVGQKDLTLSQVSVTRQNVLDFRQKIAQLISRPKDSLDPVRVEITDQELTSVLTASSAIDNLPLGFKNPQVRVTSQQIIIQGEIVSPLKSDLTIGLTPFIKDNRLSLKLTSLKAGDLTVPPLVHRAVQARLGGLIEALINQSDQFELDSVATEPGRLIMTGVSK